MGIRDIFGFRGSSSRIVEMPPSVGLAVGAWDALPTASADTRGLITRTEGGDGVADTLAVALKDSSNAYANRYPVFSPTSGTLAGREAWFLAGNGNDQWNNMPLAETEFFGLAVHRIPVDLAGCTQVRLVSSLRVAGVADSKIFLQYAATSGGTYAAIGTSAVENVLTNTGIVDSGWVALAAGAKIDDCWLKLLGSGGDGVVDPNWGYCKAMFR